MWEADPWAYVLMDTADQDMGRELVPLEVAHEEEQSAASALSRSIGLWAAKCQFG